MGSRSTCRPSHCSSERHGRAGRLPGPGQAKAGPGRTTGRPEGLAWCGGSPWRRERAWTVLAGFGPRHGRPWRSGCAPGRTGADLGGPGRTRRHKGGRGGAWLDPRGGGVGVGRVVSGLTAFAGPRQSRGPRPGRSTASAAPWWAGNRLVARGPEDARPVHRKPLAAGPCVGRGCPLPTRHPVPAAGPCPCRAVGFRPLPPRPPSSRVRAAAPPPSALVRAAVPLLPPPACGRGSARAAVRLRSGRTTHR